MRMLKKPAALFSVLWLSMGSYLAQIDPVEIPIADMLDSLSTQKMFETAFTRPIFPKNNKYKFAEDSVPWYDDFTYQARLAKLDAHSPFDLVYNEHVKSFIRLYTVRKRESVSRMMGMAQLYYPMFEEVLDKYNIPLELKHLAVIESALIPYARSRAGAMGLWQFMYPTGKMHGLKITSYIDERCDPYKATVAAAEYLKSLYNMFGDWQMVLAAYNAGPGSISKAIRRSGGKKTYWEIRPYLPLETQGYVPAFIAANYVMTHGAEHNIYPAVPRKTYFEVDTVVMKDQMSFEEMAQVLDISTEEILYFNPQFRKNIIPAGGFAVCLPKTKIAYFLNNEQAIYASIASKRAETGNMNGAIVEVKRMHTIRPGEKLSTIARKYGVTVADLKSWNYFGKHGFRPGKKVIVYVREERPVEKPAVAVINTEHLTTVPDTESNQLAAKSSVIESKPDFVTHKVKKGESLIGLGKKYGITPKAIKEYNNLQRSELRIGELLKIPN